MSIFWSDYLKKIITLEKALGQKMDYRMLDPFPVPKNVTGIQTAAQKIAQFVKLDNYIFIVGIKTLAEHAAHIELEHGKKEVFIEIDETLVKQSSPAILAALSHEISHKFLHHHGLAIVDKHRHFENEVLTDITAVYLGLGKLMLNGSRYESTKYSGSTRSVTEHRLGYLSLPQLAAVYNLLHNAQSR